MKEIQINNESDNPIKVAKSKQGFLLVQKVKFNVLGLFLEATKYRYHHLSIILVTNVEVDCLPI
ncbi:MAG: hypothetical protein WBA07_05040 [Rivularia sp. (in: cyanobacteria)]